MPRISALTLVLTLHACGADPVRGVQLGTTPVTEPSTTSSTTEPAPAFEPQAATVHRITAARYRTSVSDLLGVVYDGPLPVDLVLHGYSAVGGSELTIPPLDMEIYEQAAWDVARLAVRDEATRDDVLGCDGTEATCVRAWVAATGARAWRRSPTTGELDALEGLFRSVAATDGVELGVQAVVATVLQSPWFLFRVELGEPDPDRPGALRYTDHEMAGRLAAFLWDSVPDGALVEAARQGRLTTTTGVLDQAERMLDDPRAKEALTRFFSETLELQDLDQVDKDLGLFPSWGPELRASAVAELERLFHQVVFDDDAPYDTLLTTDDAWVDGHLAPVYGLHLAPDAPLTRLELPAHQERGGILGRVGVLALNAHATLTSPTHRGKFARARLLCQSIPPPPPGVDASLDPQATDGTLRDRLERHATDSACSGCHDAMDPLGFALEHFDPIGARRELDNGLPIDATGHLDDVPFDGAVELARAIAAHPELSPCTTLQLYRHATGQVERHVELVALDDLAALFDEDARSLQGLALALVASDAFRLASPPLGDTCTSIGDTRACATPCGTGSETCVEGRWRGCDAPMPGPETCDGVDDDCDGVPDQGLEQACRADGMAGTQVCVDGGWGTCDTAPAAPVFEVCNGVDDDEDGAIDEGLSVWMREVSSAELRAEHAGCDLAVDPASADCRAAAKRLCDGDCWVTGFGPVEVLGDGGSLTCLDDTESVTLETTYTALSGHHPGCDASRRIGPDCNAAISRFCRAAGHGTGFGPVEHVDDVAVVVCTPAATVFDASYTALAQHELACNGSVERAGARCDTAIHRWCREAGFTSGHGPLENSGDLAVVACVGVR